MLGLLALVGTVAIAIAIPTQGENPRAWGTVGCGVVTVWLCARLAARNWRLLQHYRGADLNRMHPHHTAAVTSGVRAKDAR